jgi:hypothetical protein
VDYQFQSDSKFGILTFNNVYTDLPAAAFRLSDRTWVMPRVPVPDLGIWKEWIGSIRMERLAKANLVLFAEEPSTNPEIVDAVHQRLGQDLSRLFYFVHLRSGIECESADLLLGSSRSGTPGFRRHQFRELTMPLHLLADQRGGGIRGGASITWGGPWNSLRSLVFTSSAQSHGTCHRKFDRCPRFHRWR